MGISNINILCLLSKRLQKYHFLVYNFINKSAIKDCWVLKKAFKERGGLMHTYYHPITRIEPRFDRLYADGQYHQAILLMKQFLMESEEAENPYGSLIAYFSMASCYYCLGDIEKAFETILLYEQLCENYGEQHEQFNLWHIKALIFEYEQHFYIAKEATAECIRLASMLQLPHELATSHAMMSRLMIQTEHFQQSIIHAEKALEILENHYPGDLYLSCQISCYLAIGYVQTNRFDEAKELLEVLSHHPFIQQQQRERSMFLYAYSVISAAPLADILAFLAEAEAIAASVHDYTLQKFISWHAAMILETSGNPAQAYIYMKQYAEITKQQQLLQRNSTIHELERNHRIATIERRANIDPLSGTLTRFHLETICNQWLEEAHDSNNLIYCLVFDVDDFKNINDHFGHLVGDEVIKTLGKICRKIIYEKNTLIGRYGGDEFVIILRDFPEEYIIQKAQELFQALCSQPLLIDDFHIPFSISMGMVNNLGIPARKFKQLFRLADQALYTAKKQGKNQIVTLSNKNCNIYCTQKGAT